MASKDYVQGQAAIDQNLAELKALFKRLAKNNEEFARDFCEFMHTDSHDNVVAAYTIIRHMDFNTQKMFLGYMIPCAVVGWQMAMLSINNEENEDGTEIIV